MILNRNNVGKTALERALEMKKPKSFELMLDMLTRFDEVSISKMMISSIPLMLKSGSA